MGTDPRGTWDWLNWAHRSPALGACTCPLPLVPSSAQEPSPALTPWLAPPEAARRLKSCASLLCELGREQWARSDQGFSAGPADSHTHRDGIPRQGRHLHRAPGIYCTCPSPETHRVPGSDGLFRFRDLPKPNRDPKLFFMKD